jgi:hypothetical protein
MTRASCAHRRVRRVCAIVPLALAASCSVWRPQPGVGLARPETEPVGHARALLRDGTVLDLDDASISADSIVGLGGATHTRFSLPRSDVASVEVQRTEGSLTFLAGVLATLFLFAVAGRG